MRLCPPKSYHFPGASLYSLEKSNVLVTGRPKLHCVFQVKSYTQSSFLRAPRRVVSFSYKPDIQCCKLQKTAYRDPSIWFLMYELQRLFPHAHCVWLIFLNRKCMALQASRFRSICHVWNHWLIRSSWIISQSAVARACPLLLCH